MQSYPNGLENEFKNFHVTLRVLSQFRILPLKASNTLIIKDNTTNLM